MDKLGKEINTFTLMLAHGKFNKEGLLQDHVIQRYLKVVDEPKHLYYQWWYKILYYITFKYCFGEKYEYTVESIPKGVGLANSGLGNLIK